MRCELVMKYILCIKVIFIFLLQILIDSEKIKTMVFVVKRVK